MCALFVDSPLLYGILEILEELNSKGDVLNMNVAKLLQHVAPEEAYVVRPAGLPGLPLRNETGLEAFESFLSNELNFTATVSFHLHFVFNESNIQ